MSSPGLLKRVLTRTGRFVGRRPGRVLAVAILLTICAAPLAVRTVMPANIERDLLAILTKGLPRAEAYKRLGKDFGIIDRHLILIEMEDVDDLPLGKQLADRIAFHLNKNPLMVRSARSRLSLKKFFAEQAYVYYGDLPQELSASLSEKFSDAGLARAMQANIDILKTNSMARSAVLKDPLQLRDLLPEMKRVLAGKMSSGKLIDPQGYIVSTEIDRGPGRNKGQAVLLSVEPAIGSSDHEFIGRLLSYTKQCIKDARSDVFTEDNTETGKRISTRIGGAYAMGQHMSHLVGGGIAWSAVTSFVLIVLLFAVVYLRPGAFLFIGVPLIIPVVWTLAVAPLPLYLCGYDGRLSMLGGVFCAVLLGLSIDYAIHIYNHYITSRARDVSPEDAAEASMVSTGEGIILGGMTTVTAFLGMALTDFRAFKEFGIMAGLGVFLTMIALLLCLPSALAFLSRLRGKREGGRLPLSFGLNHVLALIRRCPMLIALLTALLFTCSIGVLLLGPGQIGVNFESDIGKMGPPPEIDVVGELNRRIGRLFRLDYKPISVVISGSTPEETLEKTSEFITRVRKISRVQGVRGITDLIPPPSRQKHSLALARKQLLPNLKNLEARMARAAETVKLNPAGLAKSPDYRQFIDSMAKMAQRIEGGTRLKVTELRKVDSQVADLAAFMFVKPGNTSNQYRTHTQVSLTGYEGLDSKDYQALERQFEIKGSDISMTNHILVMYELKDSVSGDLFKVTSTVAAIVLLMLFCSLRRISFVLLALSPVLMGAVFMMATMKISSWVLASCGSAAALDFNYLNILVFPVLIGIGVDNAVHLIIRARQDNLNIDGAVTVTGRATVMCSLTTMLGFLSLCTCPHWGIRSLGIVVAIGMCFAMLVSILFVPAGLELLRRREERKNSGGAK
jgi:uncharacterized protein